MTNTIAAIIEEEIVGQEFSDEALEAAADAGRPAHTGLTFWLGNPSDCC